MKSARMLAVGTVGILFAISAQAGPILLGSTAYTQDFDGMPISGNKQTPNNAELSEQAWTGVGSGVTASGSGWWQAFTTFTRNNTGDGNHASAFSAGIAGVGVATDRAFGLGIQSPTVFSAIGAQFQNDTGSAITELNISYDGEMWYMGGIKTVADTMKFAYSTDATSLTDGTWTDVSTLNFSSPFTTTAAQFQLKDGNDAANRTAGIADSITGLNIADGATFFVRWYSVDNGGKNDGLTIDNVSITAVPEPATFGLVAIFGGAALLIRRRRFLI